MAHGAFLAKCIIMYFNFIFLPGSARIGIRAGRCISDCEFLGMLE